MKEGRSGTTLAIGEASLPLQHEVVDGLVRELGVDLRTASIREMNRLVNAVEQRCDTRFIRMEFGIPGLPVSRVAVDAEIEALRERGVAHVYAPFEGVAELKQEASRFVKLFMDLDVPPSCCVPTIGAMQGCFASLAVAGRLDERRRTVLFLEPGFPVNKRQVRFLGLRRDSIDFYDHRGDRLIRAVEARVSRGDVCAVLWSSPNNPTWIVLDESELQGLGRVCDEHDVFAIEDLAYFGMDVRQDYTRPGEPPFQPTVLRYTDHGVSIVSSSKMFSYAGQRIALSVISPSLTTRRATALEPYFGTAQIGHALMHGVLYPMTASVPESPQYGLLALLRAANSGDTTLFAPRLEYARRARVMKRLFLDNGFRLVYDNDLGAPLADGFYFTVSHPQFADGADLLHELLYYGVSAITLESAGSCRTEGLRACVSLVGDAELEQLRGRLAAFSRDRSRTGAG